MNDTNIHIRTKVNKFWSAAIKRFDYNFEFAFSNRDEYCEFRRLWKAAYVGLSELIRMQKRLVATTMRQQEHAGKHQVRLLSLKEEATIQLAMRRAAKVESNRQYLAAKQIIG